MKTGSAPFRAALSFVADFIINNDDELERRARGDEYPSIPTVYCMVTDDNDIYYVGQTQDLRRRFHAHENDPKKAHWPWTRLYYFVPGVPAHHHRLQAETILIVTAMPPGNQAVMLKQNKAHCLSEIRYKRVRRKRNG